MAGLTPLEALRAATLHNAIALGISDERGTLHPGKVGVGVCRCDGYIE